MTARRVRWAVGLVGGALVSSVVSGLAFAAGNEPPVAAPDEVTLLPGGSTYVDVMANDSDDFGQQALCRARGDSDVESGVDRGKIWVDVYADQPDDYQVQYQACDYDYLSVGTVTVHAVEPQDVVVKKVVDQPGVLRATNPNPVRLLVAWAGAHSHRLEGHVMVRAGATKDFTVTHHHIIWVAFDPSSVWDDGSLITYDEIRHIALPTKVETPRTVTPTRLSYWWHRARAGTTRPSGAPLRASSTSPWPADPTTVAPPTPKTDTIHWWSGSWDRVDVTANDTDPQGDPLDVCRLSPDAQAPSLREVLTPGVYDGQLDVGTARRVSGTFELPYYVCNSGRLAPALLRVVLTPAEPLTVTRLDRDPHLVRIHNPNPVRVRFALKRPHAYLRYGVVAPHATKTISAPPGARRWEGSIGRHGGYAGSGLIIPG
jgi:hypothetical protein